MEETFDHPAQKPVVLAEIQIRNHLEAGDPFLDRHDEGVVSEAAVACA
jgi:DNA modification methylase